MRTTAVVVPVVVVSLIFGLVWSVSMLTLRSGALAVEGSVELLRLQMKVARLNEALLVHSRDRLESQLEELDALAARAAAWEAAEAAGREAGTRPSDPDPELATAPMSRRSAPARRFGAVSSPAE